MSKAETSDTRMAAVEALQRREDALKIHAHYRRMSPEDLRQQYLTVQEAADLARVAARALNGDPDGALLQLESVPVGHLQDLHVAVIELIAAHQKARALFSIGGSGSVH